MATPVSYQPFKRQFQQQSPSKGAKFVERGTGMKDGPERTASWPTPDQLGNAAKRLRGVKRVKTRMWERI